MADIIIKTTKIKRYGRTYLTSFGMVEFDNDGIATIDLEGVSLSKILDVFPDAYLKQDDTNVNTDITITFNSGWVVRAIDEIHVDILRGIANVIGIYPESVIRGLSERMLKVHLLECFSNGVPLSNDAELVEIAFDDIEGVISDGVITFPNGLGGGKTLSFSGNGKIRLLISTVFGKSSEYKNGGIVNTDIITNDSKFITIAEDGKTTIEYDCVVGENELNLIDEFIVDGAVSVDIDNSTGVISVIMPRGADLSALNISFSISEEATSVPEAGEIDSVDLSNAYIIAVTSESGSVKMYKATAQNEKNSETDILAFTVPSQEGESVIAAGTVVITVPFGTDVTDLVPSITLSDGATVSPSSGVSNDFTEVVTYIVTAENGVDMEEYEVTVIVAENDEADITQFDINGQVGDTVIDNENLTIAVTVPFGTDVTSLVTDIVVSENATVSPLSGVAVNFTNPVTYTVTAEDGVTISAYVVTVALAAE